jgi:hypothetical protein
MTQTVLQFDFRHSGPWGTVMAARLKELAKDIAGEEGLAWKMWLEDREGGRAGGIYLFNDPVSAARYRRKHEDRLAALGITEIEVRSFEVNAPLSIMTGAPVRPRFPAAA